MDGYCVKQRTAWQNRFIQCFALLLTLRQQVMSTVLCCACSRSETKKLSRTCTSLGTWSEIPRKPDLGIGALEASGTWPAEFWVRLLGLLSNPCRRNDATIIKDDGGASKRRQAKRSVDPTLKLLQNGVRIIVLVVWTPKNSFPMALVTMETFNWICQFFGTFKNYKWKEFHNSVSSSAGSNYMYRKSNAHETI